MQYEQSILIPKNTPIETPVLADLQVHSGNLTHVEVYFPPRCAGLAHLRIFYWERQIYPSNPDSYFTADGYPIAWSEDLDLVDPPFRFSLRGWNDDDTFPHTPIVRMTS